jgi:hypothetical protein
LGERKITGNDDIISEFQYIVNALLFAIQAKYDRKNKYDFFSNFKTLIIDSISQVQNFNRDSYIHYDKTQNQTVLLQEMYSLLGTIRHGVPMNSFLVQSNVFDPFQFKPKIINNLQESDFTSLREQICHLFNSNNQSNRKGETLIISESFLNSAYDEAKKGSLSLSAEEYSRFCQADVFILNTETGIIVMDMTEEAVQVSIFLWTNSTDDQKEFVANILKNQTRPLFQELVEGIICTYGRLRRVLKSMFERDIHRMNILLPILKGENLKVYPINMIKIDRRKEFIITVMLNVLIQSNPRPTTFYNQKSQYFFKIANNDEDDEDEDTFGVRGLHCLSKTYTTHIHEIFSYFGAILENIVADEYKRQEFASFNEVSTILMAILGQYMCYNQSIFTLSGMGYDYTLSFPNLTYNSFFNDFVSGEICSLRADMVLITNIIIIIIIIICKGRR